MLNIKQMPVTGDRRKLLFLLALLVFLIITDGVLTIALVGSGNATEANPLLRPMVGDSVFMVLKVAGALLISALMWVRFSRLSLVGAWIGVAGYSMIVLWNTGLFLIT